MGVSNLIIPKNPKCYYCGTMLDTTKRSTDKGEKVTPKDLTIDHMVPMSRGGTGMIDNKVLCCLRCNHDKGCLTAEEFRVVLMYRLGFFVNADRFKEALMFYGEKGPCQTTVFKYPEDISTRNDTSTEIVEG